MESRDLYRILGIAPGTARERLLEVAGAELAGREPAAIAALAGPERIRAAVRAAEVTAVRDLLLDPAGHEEYDRLHQEIRKRQEELARLDQRQGKGREPAPEAVAEQARTAAELRLLEAHRSRLYFLGLRLAAARLFGLRRAGGLAREAAEAIDESWALDREPGEPERWRTARDQARRWAENPLPGIETEPPRLEVLEEGVRPPRPPAYPGAPVELRRELLATALRRGDARLLELVLATPELEVNPAWTGKLDPERGDDPEHRQRLGEVERDHLADPEAAARARWAGALAALEHGRGMDAAFILGKLEAAETMAALLFDEASDRLAQDELRPAARLLVMAADLERPIGPRHEEIGPALHARCPNPEVGCLTDRPLAETVLVGLGLMLGGRAWTGRLAPLAADTRAALLRELAALRDPDMAGFLDRLAEALALVPELEGAEGEKRRELLGSFAPALLGRRLPDERFDLYFYEIARLHPVACLALCLEVMGRALYLVPKAGAARALLDLLRTGRAA